MEYLLTWKWKDKKYRNSTNRLNSFDREFVLNYIEKIKDNAKDIYI